MLARPHTHLSNRAKVRSAVERRPVFRSVLESPFQINWPPVPTNVQNLALARLVAFLESAPPRADTGRKSSRKLASPSSSEAESRDVDTTPPFDDRVCAVSVSGASPHFVIGINVVTRALELELRQTRTRVVLDHPRMQATDQLPSRPAPPPITVVFVSRADVDPTALIDHLPYLIAGCNSPRNVTQPIRLIPLPKGSEQTISQILGVRRAAVIAFRRGSPLFDTFQDVLDSVPVLSAPWLCPSSVPQLVPTHIKQLRTTAPKDMKAAREQRSRARAAAKQNVSHSSRSIRRKPRVTLTTGTENGA